MPTKKDEPTDPEFADAKVIPGLEHLGRAIVDENGQPSGSPANYENLRGRMAPGTGELPSVEEVIDEINKSFPKDE